MQTEGTTAPVQQPSSTSVSLVASGSVHQASVHQARRAAIRIQKREGLAQHAHGLLSGMKDHFRFFCPLFPNLGVYGKKTESAINTDCSDLHFGVTLRCAKAGQISDWYRWFRVAQSSLAERLRCSVDSRAVDEARPR